MSLITPNKPLKISFESALLLDYRQTAQPMVIYAAELSEQNSWIELGSMTEFLAKLRRTTYSKRSMINSNLSALTANDETFWAESNTNPPVAKAALSLLEDKFEIDLPDKLRSILLFKNGGKARFEYLPP